MDTHHSEQAHNPDSRNIDRESLRELILKTEADIHAAHDREEDNKDGGGLVEQYRHFPPLLEDFVADADDVFSGPDQLQVTALIELAAQGHLSEPEHRQDLEKFVDYLASYQERKGETYLH